MIQLDKEKRKTDQAWNLLYTRLEQDGLLPEAQSPERNFRLQPVKWAAAIALLCISMATIYFLKPSGQSSMPLLTLQNTEASTVLATTLEDGSTVYLGDKASLQYPKHFSTDKREVTLVGDALFEVSGNPDRPFLIEAGKVQIEVIGTSFHVKNTKNSPFQLSVQRGKVKVGIIGEQNKDIYVKAGQTITLAGQVLEVTPTEDAEQFLRYLKHIQFKDERLADIIHIINRDLSDIPLQASPSLQDRRLTVGFYENTPEDMAELICQALKLKYTRENDILMITEP